MTGIREAAAYDLGRAAYQACQPRQPAYDHQMRRLLDGLPVGRGRPLLDAWLRGFDQAGTEAAREALAR